MEPIWWILINKEQIGPITYLELEKESRVTPDTYVWKEGMENWQRARDVEELKGLFEDKEPQKTTGEEEEETPLPDDELTIQVKSQPPYFFVWFFLITAILLYVWYLYG